MLILKSEYGGIAQLGERLNGIQEVSGSIPLISTKKQSLKRVTAFLQVVFILTRKEKPAFPKAGFWN